MKKIYALALTVFATFTLADAYAATTIECQAIIRENSGADNPVTHKILKPVPFVNGVAKLDQISSLLGKELRFEITFTEWSKRLDINVHSSDLKKMYVGFNGFYNPSEQYLFDQYTPFDDKQVLQLSCYTGITPE